MESLQKSINEMMLTFETRMSAFEDELQKAPSAPSNVATITAQFTGFRTFIVQALHSLQQQVEILARGVDSLEMQGRRKILLIHGVDEEVNEDTQQIAVGTIREKLKFTDFTQEDIRRCHRMGRSTSNKPRPILLKLSNVVTRDRIWFAKKILRSTGVTISEFLTKGRHDVFLAAREKYGVTRCWTKAGCVYVLGPDGTRHRIVTSADLSAIESASSAPAVPVNITSSYKATGRLKRTTAMKK